MKERVLAIISDAGLGHAALTAPSESTAEELAEEVAHVRRLIAGEVRHNAPERLGSSWWPVAIAPRP